MSAINDPELAHFETVFESSHFLKHHDDKEEDPEANEHSKKSEFDSTKSLDSKSGQKEKVKYYIEYLRNSSLLIFH